MLLSLLSVGAGGFLGAISRYLLFILCANVAIFGLGTLIVNILGSLLAGVLIGFIDQSSNIRLFLIVGFLGSFTTFSAFSMDALYLFNIKAYLYLSVYVVFNVMMSLAAVAIGYFFLARFITSSH